MFPTEHKNIQKTGIQHECQVLVEQVNTVGFRTRE